VKASNGVTKAKLYNPASANVPAALNGAGSSR
jgi:hypothetical protein